jgi:hypothetical protein
MDFYRGGNSLKPRPIDVRIDPRTGLLSLTCGVSLSSVPDGLEKFGGPYRVENVPGDLRIIQRGRNPRHYVLAPTRAMTLAEYEAALSQIVLVPAQPGQG